MRPIDLTPEDERGRGGGGKSSPLAYLLIGGLIALLAGVAMLVSTGNEISSSETEISETEARIAVAEKQAAELAGYTQLAQVRRDRVATVSSLAESRFDWERVMRELSLILPADVWLSSLTGSVKPEVAVNGASGVTLRTAVPGPALEIVGCAKGQEAVAGFVTALKDIDGVTRVAMQYSKLGGAAEAGAAPETDSASAGTGDCSASEFVAAFQIVAAFDAAPIPATGSEGVEE